MTKLKPFLKKYSLPILSGFLFGTTHIPFYPWALAFCLTPLWIFWTREKNNLKTLFIGGWITQFILTLIGFHWVANTAIEFGGFPPVLGYVILLLFASVAHLYFAVAGVLWSLLSRRSSTAVSLFLIPLLFAICESYNPTIFFWHLGYTWLWAGLPGAQAAEWVGFYGINLFTLAINLMIVIYVLKKQKKFLVYAVFLFCIPNAVGWALKNRFQEGDQNLNVLVIQANIGNAIKVEQDKGSRFHEFILRKFSELTAQGLEKYPESQFILWPETAYPARVTAHGRKDSFQQRLSYSIHAFERPLLTGAYEQDENNSVYNSLVLFDKNGNFVQSYKKTMLLAFGEYFPGAELIPQLKTWFPMVSDFARGSGPHTLKLPDSSPIFGAQICYESLFDYNSKSLYDQNAQVIVNVTNDSWFGYAFEPYQHLYVTLARALEFRIPLIRSTNTGISAAITAGGVMSEFSPRHEEWVGRFTVPYRTEKSPTLFSYYADLWPEILLFILLLTLLGGRFARTRNS